MPAKLIEKKGQIQDIFMRNNSQNLRTDELRKVIR